MRSVAIATAPGVEDPDEGALIAALARVGWTARACVWSDPDVAWEAFDQVVVRSTWDYTDDPAAFLAWARARASILNPAPVLAYSADKRYLLDLAARGLPTVATRLFAPGDEIELPEGAVVVKPAVGAGSRGAARFAATEGAAARAHARVLARRGAVIVQPYLERVDTEGELALIYLDGALSHAVRKDALLGHAEEARTTDLRRAGISPARAEGGAREVADAVLGALGWSDLAYARVDLLADGEGWRVLELELVEPMLYLGYAEGAADRLAAGLVARSSV